MIFNVYICSIVGLLWPDDGASWGRNWTGLNKYIHKIVLFVTGDSFDLCV